MILHLALEADQDKLADLNPIGQTPKPIQTTDSASLGLTRI